MNYETHGLNWDNRSNPASPALWMLKEILPNTNPFLLDQTFWGGCLEGALYSATNSNTVAFTMIKSNCKTAAIQSAILYWADILPDTWRHKEAMTQSFQLITKRSEDVCFLGTLTRGTNREECSPLSLALQFSLSFSRFRDILKLSNFDIEWIVRREIELQNTGWTEKSLLSLFMSPGSLVPVYMFTCRLCKEQFRSYPKLFPSEVAGVALQVQKEVPWERRLRRLKRGIDPDAPLEQKRRHENRKSGKGFSKAPSSPARIVPARSSRTWMEMKMNLIMMNTTGRSFRSHP